MDSKSAARGHWKDHLAAILILGSPVLAAGSMLTAALTEMFLLPRTGLGVIGLTLLIPINFLLGAFGAAVGALRINGNVSTRIAVFIASIGFAAAVYGGTIFYAHELIPGFAEGFKQYGP